MYSYILVYSEQNILILKRIYIKRRERDYVNQIFYRQVHECYYARLVKSSTNLTSNSTESQGKQNTHVSEKIEICRPMRCLLLQKHLLR